MNSGDGDYDEADLDAPDVDDGSTAVEDRPPLSKECFIGLGNNPKLAKD